MCMCGCVGGGGDIQRVGWVTFRGLSSLCEGSPIGFIVRFDLHGSDSCVL